VFDPCKTLSEEYRQGTAALANSDEDAILPKEAYKKLPSGLVYADVRTGTGDQAVEEGSRVNIQWVLRKSNGYFVDSSEVSGGVPFIFTVGKEGEAIVVRFQEVFPSYSLWGRKGRLLPGLMKEYVE